MERMEGEKFYMLSIRMEEIAEWSVWEEGESREPEYRRELSEPFGFMKQ